MPTAERLEWLNHPTRLRMLEAAEQRFASDGFDAARVDDIAADAHVSKSHLYYHFDSKQTLLEGLIELRVGELLALKDAQFSDALRVATAGGELDDVADALRRAVHELLLPRQAFVRIALVAAIRRPEAARPIMEAIDATLADTVRLLAEAIPDIDPARAQRLFFHFALVPTLYAVAVHGTGMEVAGGTDGLLQELPTVELGVVALLSQNPG